MKRYSVSLVYENTQEKLLRVLITEAVSNEEALGKAIFYFQEETKGYFLTMKAIIEIN